MVFFSCDCCELGKWWWWLSYSHTIWFIEMVELELSRHCVLQSDRIVVEDRLRLVMLHRVVIKKILSGNSKGEWRSSTFFCFLFILSCFYKSIVCKLEAWIICVKWYFLQLCFMVNNIFRIYHHLTTNGFTLASFSRR